MIGRFGLAGKVVLVTGASAGLGAHFARTAAAAGGRVIVAARRTKELDLLVNELRQGGFEASAMILDVADAVAIEAAAEVLAGVDILVNNAGVVRDKPALEQSEADWDGVVDTNLKGAFLMAQAVARGMKERGGGSIINIASILGLRQAGGVVPYAVSKAGILQLTKSLALEWARFNIRVNAIAPGYIGTDLNQDFWKTDAGATLIKRIPQRRLGRLEELDGPLLLLASEAGAYITGTTIVADGGHLVSSL